MVEKMRFVPLILGVQGIEPKNDYGRRSSLGFVRFWWKRIGEGEFGYSFIRVTLAMHIFHW